MTEQLRFQRVSAKAGRLLAVEGESGRFEFKSTSEAVKSEVLVAAANWVALAADREEVTLLVGVREVTDPTTGLTTGEVVGLRGSLANHIELINNRAKNTFPVPIEVTVVEEGVATGKPFLRLHVRPTAFPHFDGSGRRVTRSGASTRALQDQELLDLYLDREADRFRARFESIADSLSGRLESVANLAGAAVEAAERIPGLISDAEGAASTAGAEAEDTKREVRDLARDLDSLWEELLRRSDRSPVEVFRQLRHERQRIWGAFSIDRVQRPSRASDRLAIRLKAALEDPIQLHEAVRNRAELEAWRDLFDEENAPASAAWWSRALAGARMAADTAVAPLVLPDWSDQITEALAGGCEPGDLQIEPWSE